MPSLLAVWTHSIQMRRILLWIPVDLFAHSPAFRWATPAWMVRAEATVQALTVDVLSRECQSMTALCVDVTNVAVVTHLGGRLSVV